MTRETKDYLDKIHALEMQNFQVRELLKVFTKRPGTSGILLKKIERAIRAGEEMQEALNETYCGIRSTKDIETPGMGAPRSLLLIDMPSISL